MGEPVVVQGTVIAAPAVSYGGATETTTDRQPAKTGCKDPIFAVLFYINVIAMFAVVGVYGVSAMDGVDASNYSGYVFSTEHSLQRDFSLSLSLVGSLAR
mmetsp:Transcript_26589/g.73136  ORF Transcript_26589/g.73136 Transcript_26589/m.73136 type:complete len:100 (-) Transcript_26589:4186-4485(-)